VPRQAIVTAACALALAIRLPEAAQSQRDPFAFLAPAVVVSGVDRARLDRDEVLVRTLAGGDGQVAVFVATRLNARPDALVAWTRAIAELKRSRFVLAVGRFSDPPTVADLAGLTLDPRDLDEMRGCRPGACGLKLSAQEIASLKAAISTAGARWRDAAHAEFRRLLVERVQRYRAGGLGSLPSPADRGGQPGPAATMAAIVKRSPYLERLPNVLTWLQEYPAANASVESFFYWAKEDYGEGKPVISVTHVGISRPDSDRQLPSVLVTGTQIVATHYFEGSLGLTMVLQDPATDVRYLAYVNRSQLDLLRGLFGGLVRRVLKGRLERQAQQVVRGLRARLESDEPVDDPLSGGPPAPMPHPR
jgi:hypothetical protein